MDHRAGGRRSRRKWSGLGEGLGNTAQGPSQPVRNPARFIVFQSCLALRVVFFGGRFPSLVAIADETLSALNLQRLKVEPFPHERTSV
jgi:hypothetical protein